MDIAVSRVSFPAMRAVAFPLAVCLGLGLGLTGCPKTDDTPAWQKAPEQFDVKGDSLTFGTKNLAVFNKMSQAERLAHIEALKDKPGAFKGQGRFVRAGTIGKKLDDYTLGAFQMEISVQDAVLHEITIDYQLFAGEKLGNDYNKGAYIEFSGTLAGLSFQNQSKPRKLEIKLKDVKVTRLDT